jgi:cellulose synthase (UDP-forming)
VAVPGRAPGGRERRQVSSVPDSTGLWQRREAADVRYADRLLIFSIAGAGLASLVRLADWWFREAHVSNLPLFIVLSLAFWYGVTRILLGWINYAGMRKPAHVDAPPGLRVAIFTTSSPGEPAGMFERTLAACANISYPHTTYLLDDSGDDAIADAAATHGAVHLALAGIPGAKAGKINRALESTDEEFVLVLDPDHVPFPEFLDRVLGHFRDPRVGFVQVAQAYYNQPRSFTARGAAEQTYAFYGPGLMGLFGHGAAVAIGANCTFRRAALASIGGHGIGLAEDLITAIRLHAAGWRSVYVPEIVSRGLVPEDLGSFYRQQLKWSRGVYEVFFSEMPRAFRRLRWRQRVSYLAISTYYLFGVTTAAYLLFPFLYLWLGVQPANMPLVELLVAGMPVALVGAASYLFTQRWLCDPSTERGIHWRGLVLKWACWPVVLAGTVLAIVRADVPYIPTPKQGRRGAFLRLAWPQLLLCALFAVTFVDVLRQRFAPAADASLELSSEAVWGMLAFAAVPVVAAIATLRAAWDARRPPAGAPWDDIPLDAGTRS